MIKRTITGVIAAVVLVLLIFWGSVSVLTSVVLLCTVIACVEFDRLFFPEKDLVRQIRFAMLSMFLIITMAFGDPLLLLVLAWLVFVVRAVGFVMLARSADNHHCLVRDFLIELFGYVYIASLFGFLLPLILRNEQGRSCLFLLFFLVFAGDTSAYFVGSWIGKTRLAPTLSPKKSIEGAMAAVGSSALFAVVWLKFINPMGATHWFTAQFVLFSVVVSLLAQAGDLFESLLKRSQNKKDSGFFLPGHGGILDRIDGLVFAAPFSCLYFDFVTGLLKSGL